MANYDPNSGQSYGEWLRQQNPNRQERYTPEQAREAAAQYLGRAGSEAEVRDWQTLATQTGGFNFMRNSPEGEQFHFNTSLSNPEHRGVMSSAGIAKGEYFTFDPSISARHDRRAYEVKDEKGNVVKDEFGNIIYVKGDKRASGATKNWHRFGIQTVGNLALKQVPYGLGGLAKPLTNYLDSRILNTEYDWSWRNAAESWGDWYAANEMALIRGTKTTGPKKGQRGWGDVLKQQGINSTANAVGSYLGSKFDSGSVWEAVATGVGTGATQYAGSRYVMGQSSSEAANQGVSAGVSAGMSTYANARLGNLAGPRQTSQWNPEASWYSNALNYMPVYGTARNITQWAQNMYGRYQNWSTVRDAAGTIGYDTAAYRDMVTYGERPMASYNAAMAGEVPASVADMRMGTSVPNYLRQDQLGGQWSYDPANPYLSNTPVTVAAVPATPGAVAPATVAPAGAVAPATAAQPKAFAQQNIDEGWLRRWLIPNYIERFLPHGAQVSQAAAGAGAKLETPPAAGKKLTADEIAAKTTVATGKRLIVDTNDAAKSRVISDQAPYVPKKGEVDYMVGNTVDANGAVSANQAWVRNNSKKEDSFWTSPQMFSTATALAGLGYSEYRARKADRKADRIRREDKAEVQRLQQEQQAMADAYNEEYLAALESSGSHNISSVNVWA